MSERDREAGKTNPERQARCIPIAQQGIKNTRDFAHMMSAVMSDVALNAITPMVANAITNAGGKLLKAAEIQLKYGKATSNGDRDVIQLCHGGDVVDEESLRERRRAELLEELRKLEERKKETP